ncbi:hypothetical protein cyc_00537 [Cyclospora cayetanensis]|uniref:acetate--CoA ligase n=1 Tax=Cyclospora cayetanensis TaxID=88456 RepID=A0A1D3CZR0_9EIME|nr:hypothetical protein cyc_00537 [Cyclospora cayetanensis]
MMPAAWDRDLGEACVVDRGSPNVERSDLNLEGAHEAISSFPVKEVHEPPPKNTSRCNVPSESMYKHLYWRSLTDADNFWREKALEKLRWSHPFTKTQHGSLKNGDMSWFLNGKLNVCDNCVDRWAEQYPQRIALIYEGDTSKDSQVVTYKELQDQVCRFANLLKSLDVRKGDIVTIYLPMMPEIVYAMLACLSANSLAERLEDANSRVLITATKSTRGGREVHLKKVVDEALEHVSCVKHVVLFRKSEDPSSFVEGRDLSGDDLLPQMRPYCPLEIMDSEDLLFILYTSGSTGKPKVCLPERAISETRHLYWDLVQKWRITQLYTSPTAIRSAAAMTLPRLRPCINEFKRVHGSSVTVWERRLPTAHEERHKGHNHRSVHGADVVSGGPMGSGIGGDPPLALMQHGDEWPKKYDLSTLRVIGSVGEPINPEAWRWYYENIGKGQCSVVDTYWQTETGGHVLAPFPGATITKPGCAMVPFFGIEPAIVDPQTGEEKKGNEVCGVLCLKRPWPGMCRTVHRAHKRLVNTYLQPYPGYYFTGDGAYRDADGHYWITGRVDDTLNVSGHRLSTAEIEHALVQHPRIVEAAVVGVPHEVKGTAIFCFVILKAGETPAGVIDEARKQVRKEIGPIATPDFIVIAPVFRVSSASRCPSCYTLDSTTIEHTAGSAQSNKPDAYTCLSSGLPKTQSGKIMRRLLRKLCCLDQSLGDTTSLANAEVIPSLQGLIMETVLAERKTPTTTAAEKAATSGKKAKHNSS